MPLAAEMQSGPACANLMRLRHHLAKADCAPLADVRRRSQSAAMRHERFAARFRKDASLTFWSIVAVVSLMWVLTLLDFAFGLGWGWDKRGLWAAPLILLIATTVRLCHAAVGKLMDRLSSVR